MTEDEAKTKWCPLVRASMTNPQDPNHGHVLNYGRATTACIGSDCMAWRWQHVQTNKTPPGQAIFPQTEPVYRRTEDGYCGLANGSFLS